jgi:epsilon-lactone hydrolase
MDFIITIYDLVRICLIVFFRRLRKGPKIRGWGLVYEAGTEFLRHMTSRTEQVPEVKRQREVAGSFAVPTLMAFFTEIRHINLGDLPARSIVPNGARKDRTVLYLHGGAYVFYIPMHDRLVIPFCRSARSALIVPEYRLAPEFPFPAALEDSLAAYCWLLDNGSDPARVVIAGDSAGGGLAVALLLKLRELKLPMPRLAVLLSPWVDLSCEGRGSMIKNKAWDWITPEVSLQMAYHYAQDGRLKDPLVSPLYADLRGLPPLYIQGGQAEVLHDQIHAFAARARADGVEVKLEMFPDMVHEFQAFDRYTPQSRQALTRLGRVIDQYLDR